MSSSAFFHKPELALRRALELEGIHQNDAALTLLHDVLSSRRHRTWSPTYEQIMVAYLNLCLKLHRAREAKDGLHQYRNLAQSQAPGSLEKVIRYLLEQAETKCRAAKEAADAAAAAAAATTVTEDATTTTTTSTTATSLLLTIDGGDEEVGVGPQAILLSSMSTDPAKNQRDTLMVLPSLKFLWEIYRAVLDILRSNSKLEHVYHAAAMGALKFCRTYQRRTEFRRLCDMLRIHLGNLQKYGGSEDASKPNNKVRGWEGWSIESIELHLQTRFAQLETASVLHLYTEGFRTVEDIYNILQISHQRRKQNPDLPPPKAKLMAKYYEQLTTLFWVSENHLFHAFAWYKYYALCKEYNKGMKEELKSEQASAVLLAALCIPSLPSSQGDAASTQGASSGTTRFDDSVMQEKMGRMATLLGFHTRNPTRENLLEEIAARGIFEQVPEYLQKLYYLLERDSDPLVLVASAKPLLDQLSKQVGEESALAQYVEPLQSVLLLKLLWNLSSAYHSVKIDFLKDLTSGLGMTFEQVERAIVLFTQTHKRLAVRIDHRAGCLRFGDVQLESYTMRSQLTALAQQLDVVCQALSSSSSTGTAAETDSARRSKLYESIRESRDAEHSKMLERKAWIEQRKEEIERLAQEKVRQEAEKLAAEEAARKADEEHRIAREQKLREQEKLKKIQREMETIKKQQLLQAMGYNIDSMTQDEIALLDAEKLQKEHQDKINKERDEAERKTKEIAKGLDHLVRAVRIEELPMIKEKYEEKVKKDREQYEQEVLEKAKRAKEQWESDKRDKEKLSAHSVFDYMKEFEEKAMEGRKIKHTVLCQLAEEQAEVEAEKAKMQRARKRKADEQKRIAAEEEERLREEEERKAEEERRKKEEARLEKERQEEERRQAEAARMTKEREEKFRTQDSDAARPARGLDSVGATGGANRYVPPARRGQAEGSRFDDRGSSYGGGRYEGRDRGGGFGGGRGGGQGSGRDASFGDGRDSGRDGRFGGGRDGGRDSGFGSGRDSGREGGSGGGRDSGREGGSGGGRGGGGYGDRREDAPPSSGNSRWKR